MNEELSNKIQERIEVDKIKPIPYWRFALLRGIFWLFAGLSVIVGSFAIGTILLLFFDYNQHGILMAPYDMMEFLSMIPFLWIIILVLFVIVAEKSIKHTKQGYRYRLRTIFSVIVLLSIIFGSILNYVGVGKITHEFLNEVPFYNSVVYDSKDAWSRPIIGRLAGVVVSVSDKDNFSVVDFDGHIWEVHVASSADNDSFIPEASSTVRMLGIIEASSSRFVVNSIYVWEK